VSSQPEEPRLLARASQYGYITIDPSNPDLYRAMHHEPEPLTPNQLEDLRYREAIQRQQQYAAAKGSILAIADELADNAATSHERRRLQNLQRATKSL